MKTILLAILFSGWAFNLTGQIYFEDVAVAKGILHKYTGQLGGGVSFVDFNNDGLDDLTLATGKGEKIYFYKNTGNNFIKIISPVDLEAETKQVLWVDFDNDGDFDLYTANFGEPNRLFENKGNLLMEDITENAGLPMTSNNTYGACFGDIDRDGWLDLYYCDRVPGHTSENRHYLLRNNADGTFTDIAQVSNTLDAGKSPFCSAFIDYNNDKWPDIYTAHDRVAVPNVLLENNGDGTFTDVSMASNADVAMDAMCVAPGDYNNDGWIDIYVTNTPLIGSALLQNIGPAGGGQVKFGNAAAFAGVQFVGHTGWGAAFFDADNDTNPDLYVTAADYGDAAQSNAFFLNNGNGTFSQPDAGFAGDTTITNNMAIGDFNNDGFPDIAVLNNEPSFTQLWKNNGGNNAWIKIKLHGVWSNRDGIGAKTEVYANDQYQMRYLLCGNGFLGQNSLTEIIGLGNLEKADSVVVTWPTGHIDKLYDIESGTNLLLTEGSTTNGNIFTDDDVVITFPFPNAVSQSSPLPFFIYPNPASDFLYIANKRPNRYEYQLLNSGGQPVRLIIPDDTTTKVNIAGCAPGV
ncbi:MAG TPA: CRTAC1 family protein, partial [Bacteroidetes bacterium]|nr:CRTAC1 family protein [Bacteroidota bacterium]